MNKKELIEKYEYLNHDCFRRVDTSEVLRDLKQLDEPQKVKIPKFVAEWVEESKTVASGTLKGAYINAPENVRKWWSCYNVANVQLFARAWLDGYEIEKEPRYTVMLKNKAGEEDYLVETNANGLRFYNNIYTQRRKHTRQELEGAGFGWVFDCPGMEVKEVTE